MNRGQIFVLIALVAVVATNVSGKWIFCAEFLEIHTIQIESENKRNVLKK